MSISILGLIAAFCTTISFLPQAVKTFKSRRTKELSLPTYVTLTTGLFLWFIYGIFINDMAIILANGITFLPVLSILLLKIKNG